MIVKIVYTENLGHTLLYVATIIYIIEIFVFYNVRKHILSYKITNEHYSLINLYIFIIKTKQNQHILGTYILNNLSKIV